MARADSDPAFDALVRAEAGVLERTAFLITGDREVAKEITQDAFTSLFVRWSTVSRLDRPGAWARRIVIRASVRARDRSRRGIELERRAGPCDPGTSDVDRRLDLAAALRSLPPRQRAAVVCTYYLQLTSTEAADAMGCSPATVRVHLHEARTRLAGLLGADVGEEEDTHAEP